MNKKYDVIIVGAGPAGLLAAKAAGENGLDVALLEKKTNPQKLSRACGQTLMSLNEYYFGDLVNANLRDGRISFPATGFSFRYNGPVTPIYSIQSYAPGGHTIRLGDFAIQKARGDGGRIGLSISKEVFFQCLLDEIRSLHVDVIADMNVERVTPLNDRVKVEGGDRIFEGTYLIAADGVNSQIAMMLGFNESRVYYGNLYGLSFYMTGVEPPLRECGHRTSAYLKDGPSSVFLFPLAGGDNWNVLPVTMDPRANLKVAMEHYMTRAFCAPWFKKARSLQTFSAVCNCFSPIKDPYKDRVFIIGDAASTQELENQGAMISGWKAGQAVATAVQEGKVGIDVSGVTQYVNWWQSAYINRYKHEDYIKSFAMPYIMPDENDLNYFFGLINEPLPACYNPYASPTANMMKKLMPVIQRDRPDIITKLQRRALPASQLYAEITAISKPVFGKD